MNELQEKVQRMVGGETKRREIALKFLISFTEEIRDVCKILRGDNLGAMWISEEYYFRWKIFSDESEGFYYLSETYQQSLEPRKGDNLRWVNGKDFWMGIQAILHWIPELGAEIERIEASREVKTSRLTEILAILNKEE